MHITINITDRNVNKNTVYNSSYNNDYHNHNNNNKNITSLFVLSRFLVEHNRTLLFASETIDINLSYCEGLRMHSLF